MPLDKSLKKVMVIGSGPIVIGQAAEFDYAGTQACRALKEEGIEVVLVNSNPATIMTDTNIADWVYMEPITLEYLTEIIEKERPDGLLATLGGQAGLNSALKLAKAGILEKYDVKVLGTSIDAIERAEDREMFKNTMEEIGQPVPESTIVSTIEEAIKFANEIGYPVIVRPAYTLGGTGGGIVHSEDELKDIVNIGLKASIIGQALIERSVAGYKEVEYEIIRDAADNCICVCNMENVDPVGVHTGDSIVVAPSQTLTTEECKMLRNASSKIIRALGISGGCNIQYALDTKSNKYYLIEVNPRVSRSSALASKATGYPIAKVVSKIAIGYNLDEIPNAVTGGKTTACSEPSIDYIVFKMARWPFDKFTLADCTLGTQMKATGEVMSLERTFEAALLKAVRSLEIGLHHLYMPDFAELSTKDVKTKLKLIDDKRIFLIAEALRRDIKTKDIAKITSIDIFFLEKIKNIILMERELATGLNNDKLAAAKKMGFSDKAIAQYTEKEEETIRAMRKKINLTPSYKIVDTCAAEYDAETSYYYSTYGTEDEVQPTNNKKVLVLGSGPIRIGQGVEFDYCSVHSVWALREMGIETVIINNNPETVSTDFDTSDRLYFEPLAVEDVLSIIEKEKPEGVIVQFGGQTAINLAGPLAKENIKIFGTSVESIDRAENREKFEELLEKLNIPRAKGIAVFDTKTALNAMPEIGYPVVVRPSYVLGGRAMEIVYNEKELSRYLKQAFKLFPDHPVLVDHYLQGVEVEVDAISDGKNVLIPGIMEHIERAGVHSGDSIAVYPPRTLSKKVTDTIVSYTEKLAKELKVKGVVNIQYVTVDEKVYVIEVNPRSSRTIPFLSKVTGVPMVNVATKVAMGESLKNLGYGNGLLEEKSFKAVKVPVFSFAKLQQVDINLGPEMKSTGEVMGIDYEYSRALYKGVIAAGMNVPDKGTILFTVADKDKEEAGEVAKKFAEVGYDIIATSGTAKYLESIGLKVEKVAKIHEQQSQIIDLIKTGRINMVVNTITKGRDAESDGFKIRRATVEHSIMCLTSMDTAWAIVDVLNTIKQGKFSYVLALQDYANNGERNG